MIECSLTLQRKQTYVYITKNKWKIPFQIRKVTQVQDNRNGLVHLVEWDNNKSVCLTKTSTCCLFYYSSDMLIAI